MSYSSQKSCVKIWFRLVESFKSYHLNFLGGGGGQKPHITGLHVTCDAHFQTWSSYSSQKSYVKIWFGLVVSFKSYHVHKHFSGWQKPPIRGGYIWPVMSIFELGWAISVKKSCVKICFGLVEIGGMLILRGRKTPLWGGLYVTCDAHFRTWPRFSRWKACVKIWFGLLETFKRYCGYKKKDK